MHARRFFALAFAAGVAACGGAQPELVPGAGAMPAPGNGATASSMGVRLDIDTDAWRGVPNDLGDNFTPVLITVTNEGDRPLRVRYADFVLSGPTSDVYHALPPFRISDTVSEPITDLSPYRGFMIAPYLSRYYPRMRVFGDPFEFDRVYFDTYHPSFVEIQLPTNDMIQRALPEGVLEPGGRITGFLYFEDPEDEVGRVTLVHSLMSPSGETFGRIEIPLETRN